MVKDITEHKRAEEKLERAYEELKSLDELKSNIVANVSHELRTLLTIARSAMELLRREEDLQERDNFLKMSLNALGRQNMIIGDLISAASMEKKRELELAAVDMAQTMGLIKGEFKPMAAENKVKMDAHVEEDLPMAYADYEQLQHVLRNIIGNAIKFNQEGGEVVVEARKKGYDRGLR